MPGCSNAGERCRTGCALDRSTPAHCGPNSRRLPTGEFPAACFFSFARGRRASEKNADEEISSAWDRALADAARTAIHILRVWRVYAGFTTLTRVIRTKIVDG